MITLTLDILELSAQRTSGERNGAVVIIAVIIAFIFLLVRGKR